ANQFLEQLAEMRLFDLLKSPAAVFCRVCPLVRLRADEGAHGLAVAEVDPVHGDDLVDNAGELAAGLRAFHLKAEFSATELVDDALEDANKDDVLLARVLQLMQPHQHFSRV